MLTVRSYCVSLTVGSNCNNISSIKNMCIPLFALCFTKNDSNGMEKKSSCDFIRKKNRKTLSEQLIEK